MHLADKLLDRFDEYERQIAYYEKINKVLMNRVERSIDSTGDAFSLFESNILLQNTVNERTQELARANRQLQQELEKQARAEEALKLSNRELQAEIAERLKVENELRAFTAKLKESNRELEEFASVASHDLQEPLRKVRAFGDRLKAVCGDTLSDRAKDYLERMQSAAGRMQTLIEDLLVFSRVTSKANPFVPVDLSEIVRGVVSDLEMSIEDTKGRVVIEELPEIYADPLQMRQLLQNLICNGLKFHKKDEQPVVKVYGESFEDPDQPADDSDAGENIHLVVEDNGIGFEAKHSERVFGIFQRLHSRSEYEGTGIGLAVCRKIARRHGGEITARSEPGAGAKFIVTLPRKHHRGEKDEERARETNLHPVG